MIPDKITPVQCGTDYTSDFSNSLSAVSAHDGQGDHTQIFAALHKRGRQEAWGAHVAWMGITLNHSLTHVLLIHKDKTE